MKVIWVARECNIRQRTAVCSRVNERVEKNVGIETKLSMAHYPQTDGQIERTNQELE